MPRAVCGRWAPIRATGSSRRATHVPPRRDRAPSRLEGRAQPRAGRTLALRAEAVQQNPIRPENPPHLGAPEAVCDGEGALGLCEAFDVHSSCPQLTAVRHSPPSCTEVQFNRDAGPGHGSPPVAAGPEHLMHHAGHRHADSSRRPPRCRARFGGRVRGPARDLLQGRVRWPSAERGGRPSARHAHPPSPRGARWQAPRSRRW